MTRLLDKPICYLCRVLVQTYALIVVAVVLALLPTPALGETLENTGSAYAVLTSEGSLIFFRSDNAYENLSTGTFVDIAGTERSGRIFCGIETTSAQGTNNCPWYDYQSSITDVRIAEGQTIRPLNISLWFSGCLKLATCDLARLDTSRVKNMGAVFYNCRNPAFNPDVSTWDTSQVTDMQSIFCGCSGAAFNPDVSGWDTSRVTNMYCLFRDCSGASFNPDVSMWDVSSAVCINYLFNNCKGQAFAPDVSQWNTSSVLEAYGVFYGCSGSTFNPDVSSWDVSQVFDMGSMFAYCSGNAFNPDVSRWNTGSATNMNSMFLCCYGDSFNPDVSDWDTSQVTTMQSMFNGCYGASFNPDVSRWNTARTTDMGAIFCRCLNLTSLDLSQWNTHSATNMLNMFAYCNSLKSVTLGEQFSFKGSSTTATTNRALLPTPAVSSPNVGRWVNVTTSDALPVTAQELCDGYDGSLTSGSLARGTYVWRELREFTLNLNLDGGTASVTYPSSYIAGFELPLPGTSGSNLPAPTKAGYDFAGWVDEDGNMVNVVEDTSDANRSFRASWVVANISFTVPATIGCVMTATGTLIGPANAYIENCSPWPIHVSSVLVSPHEGWTLVASNANQSGQNQVSMLLGPDGDMLDVAGCLNANSVTNIESWSMEPATDGKDNRLPIFFTGHISRPTISLEEPIPLLTIEWQVAASS